MYKLYKLLYDFGDKLEDHVRGYLSHYPIVYAIVGGVGVVIFWRGVWHTMDYLMLRLGSTSAGSDSISLSQALWWDGPLSLLIGLVLLLMIGIFVSNFIGNEIIISGIKGEKKIAEKTEKEVKSESGALTEIRGEFDELLNKFDKLEHEIKNKEKKPENPS